MAAHVRSSGQTLAFGDVGEATMAQVAERKMPGAFLAQVTVTAMSRELAGFVWAVGRQREAEMNTQGLPVERPKEAGKHPHGKEQSSKHLCDRHGRAELAPLV